MNDLLAFVLLVAALLSVPGPTNTLLAASGAAVGFRSSLKLIPAAIGGYLLAIGCLLAVVGPIAAAHPLVPIASKLAAAVYLAWSAIRLWRNAESTSAKAPAAVLPRQVFLTTLLNPKAFVFAFVVFRNADPADLGPQIAIFATSVPIAAGGWIVLGSTIARSAGASATPPRISRLAAIVLGGFATLIAGSAVTPL